MKRRSFKFTKKKIALITAIVVVIGVIGGVSVSKRKSVDVNSFAVSEDDIVTYGDIKSVTTGQAAVEPYERFEIISMVSGDIVSSPFDVGDEVQEGDVLYQFDTKDALEYGKTGNLFRTVKEQP